MYRPVALRLERFPSSPLDLRADVREQGRDLIPQEKDRARNEQRNESKDEGVLSEGLAFFPRERAPAVDGRCQRNEEHSDALGHCVLLVTPALGFLGSASERCLSRSTCAILRKRFWRSRQVTAPRQRTGVLRTLKPRFAGDTNRKARSTTHTGLV